MTGKSAISPPSNSHMADCSPQKRQTNGEHQTLNKAWSRQTSYYTQVSKTRDILPVLKDLVKSLEWTHNQSKENDQHISTNNCTRTLNLAGDWGRALCELGFKKLSYIYLPAAISKKGQWLTRKRQLYYLKRKSKIKGFVWGDRLGKSTSLTGA